MAEDTWHCPRCGKGGDYYSTDKTICPVTKKCVCPSCASAAESRFNHFGGSTYDPDRDGKRLSAQQKAVLDVMRSGDWFTIPQVAEAIGAPPESLNAIGARIRDIRKIYQREDAVERRHVSGGLWEYRMTVGVAA